ncbi:MAG: PilN domain-containing protein [Desulfohalobiaceae bacterium]
MIRINLLPKQQRSKVSRAGKELTLFVSLLIIFVLGAVFFQVRLTQQVQDLEQVRQEKSQRRQELLKQVAEVNKLQDQLEETQDKIEIIKQIRLKQSRPVRYLDQLVRNLPHERLWFESLQMDNQGMINLEGIALDNQSFASYVQQLRGSDYIQDIVLRQTSRKEINNLDLIAFSCQIRPATQQEQEEQDE